MQLVRVTRCVAICLSSQSARMWRFWSCHWQHFWCDCSFWERMKITKHIERVRRTSHGTSALSLFFDKLFPSINISRILYLPAFMIIPSFVRECEWRDPGLLSLQSRDPIQFVYKRFHCQFSISFFQKEKAQRSHAKRSLPQSIFYLEIKYYRAIKYPKGHTQKNGITLSICHFSFSWTEL